MRGWVVVAAVVVGLMALQPAYAHSPSKIEISYDAARQEVTVVVTHQVSNPLKHYVRQVTLFLNGEPMREEVYMQQEDAVTQTGLFKLKGVKSGDEIAAEASCSRGGSMRESVFIEASAGGD